MIPEKKKFLVPQYQNLCFSKTKKKFSSCASKTKLKSNHVHMSHYTISIQKDTYSFTIALHFPLILSMF